MSGKKIILFLNKKTKLPSEALNLIFAIAKMQTIKV